MRKVKFIDHCNFCIVEMATLSVLFVCLFVCLFFRRRRMKKPGIYDMNQTDRRSLPSLCLCLVASICLRVSATQTVCHKPIKCPFSAFLGNDTSDPWLLRCHTQPCLLHSRSDRYLRQVAAAPGTAQVNPQTHRGGLSQPDRSWAVSSDSSCL